MSGPSFDNPCLGRLIAGARPQGSIHIGELVGAIQSWVRLQDNYECIFIIADVDTQSTPEHPDYSDKRNIYEMLADWLAAGISPNYSIITLESAVPERLKLADLLRPLSESNLWPVAGSASHPAGAIEAVEMLMFKADVVPLPQDQPDNSLTTAQILGLAFNQKYGEIFPTPKAQLIPAGHLLGLDGRPMQRSFHNTILLKEFDDETERKIETAPVDTLIMYATRFDHEISRSNAVIEGFLAGSMSEKELRKYVTTCVNDYLHSARVKRDKWIANTDELEAILQVGARKARAIAGETIAEAGRAMHRT